MDLESVGASVGSATADLPEVVAVFLFGSVAEGRARPTSDVDLGILFVPTLQRERRLDLALEIAARVRAGMRREVDVIDLEAAPSALAFRALRGKIVVDRDPVARSLWSMRVISRYHDHRRVHDVYARALAERAAEGRFGTAR